MVEEYILGSVARQPNAIDHFRSVVLLEENQLNWEYLERVESCNTFDWFNSRTVNDAMHILRKQFPSAAGLQSICSTGDHFLIKSSMFLQILRKSTRYILVSAWNLEDGHINMYDPSKVSSVISKDTETRIANLVVCHNTSPKLNINIIHLGENVKQEYSGVVCVAIAVYLLTGYCPGMLDLNDLGGIIEHMTNCLKEKKFSTLPSKKESFKFSRLSFKNKSCLPPIGCNQRPTNVFKVTKEISLHCLCHRPKDEYMERCNKCRCFFHQVCIERFGCTEAEFLCPDCVRVTQLNVVPTLPHLPFAFDAYVSYKCSDLWFVKKHLIPCLEHGARYNYKLAIGERDFIPGHVHVDEMMEKLALSSKCLIIVSKDFLYGTLKLLEWDQIARHRWFSAKVILIDPYEEVTARCGDISKCFNNYMKQKKHLQWKHDMTEMEEIRFWKSIRTFLSSPLSQHHMFQPEPRVLYHRTSQEQCT